MKNIFALSKSFLLVLLLIGSAGCDKEVDISPADLPSEILEYVRLHFPDHPVIRAVKDIDGRSMTYEVKLEGGYKLEFNEEKEVIEIEGKSKLPDSVIPEKILAYVQDHYPGHYIIEWEIEGENQQVELDNKVELLFTISGDFIKID